MQNSAARVSRRDWTIYASRWLFLTLIGVAVFSLAGQKEPAGSSPFLTSLLIAAAANLILIPFVAVPALQKALAPALLLADVVTVGAFAFASANPAISGAATALVIISCLVRPDIVWNALTIIGAMLVLIVTVAQVHNAADSFSPALLGLALLAGAALVVSAVLDRECNRMRRRFDAMSRYMRDNSTDQREYIHAIKELTYSLSASLDYKQVLEAALVAGRLGLRLPEREESSLYAAVLLFHADDNHLHIASHRRFARADEQVRIAGKEGIVGRALQEAVPVFGVDARKDPELQYFIALQYCKSILCIPLRAGFDNFGVLVYASEKANAFTQDHGDVLSMIGIQATIALQNALLYHNLLEEKQRIVDAEEEARKKLARDLHDGPIQGVAAIAMRAGIIQKMLLRQPAEVPDELKKVEDLARQTTKEMRHLLFTLRPLALESQGLTAALDQLAEKMLELHGQAVAVRVDPRVERLLDRQQQDVIFYIAEEAVNNARKHAQASIISVTVGGKGRMGVLEIADNGKGFSVDKVSQNYEQRGSLGMVNMRERAALLDGTLNLQSAPGKGTRITVVFPLKSNEVIRATNGRTATKLAVTSSALFEPGESTSVVPRNGRGMGMETDLNATF